MHIQDSLQQFHNLMCFAGVWRRKAIVTVGGWKSRTTVEDMDLSLRTYVNGWKAIYLTDVTCINEVGGMHLVYASNAMSSSGTCGTVSTGLMCAEIQHLDACSLAKSSSEIVI